MIAIIIVTVFVLVWGVGRAMVLIAAAEQEQLQALRRRWTADSVAPASISPLRAVSFIRRKPRSSKSILERVQLLENPLLQPNRAARPRGTSAQKSRGLVLSADVTRPIGVETS